MSIFSNFQVEMPNNQSSLIKVLGVGGGGCNAVSYMFNQGIAGVDFLVCNTDMQVLDKSPVPTKIQIGSHLTEGLGAGSLPEVGKASALESIDEIINALGINTKMLFVTAGMGGGTGTGAAPVIAKAAKELGILTVGIVTTPFQFEGPVRMEHALAGVEEMKEAVDALLVISNEKLKILYAGMGVRTAFAKADDVIAIAAKGIAEIITINGMQNVDLNDVKTAMTNSGKAIMGTGVAEGEGRAKSAAEKALYSPLLDENTIQGAKWILVNISSGDEDISMDEYYEINNFFQELAGNRAQLKCGYCYNPDLGEKISITLIATGFETSAKNSYKTAEENQVVTETEEETIIDSIDMLEESLETSFDTGETKPVQRIHTLDMQTKISPSNIEQIKREKIMMKDVSDKLRTGSGIKELESVPAYLRRNMDIKNVEPVDAQQVSRYSLYVDEEKKKMEIRTNNSFIHDQVD